MQYLDLRDEFVQFLIDGQEKLGRSFRCEEIMSEVNKLGNLSASTHVPPPGAAAWGLPLGPLLDW